MNDIIKYSKVLTVEDKILYFLKYNNKGFSIRNIAKNIGEDYRSTYITVNNLLGRGLLKEFVPAKTIRIIFLNTEEKKKELDEIFENIENKIKSLKKEEGHNGK